VSIKSEAHEHIKKRAKESNILDRVIIDPEEYEDGKFYYSITGIWEGAIDEDFIVEVSYAVNVADWLGELYQTLRQEGESWQILVVEFFPDEAGDGVDLDGNLVYKVDDESFGG